MEPWRYSSQGLRIALRVMPRGGRDGIDGIEMLADGRPVVKVRVRAVADGGEANALSWRCWRRRWACGKSMSGYLRERRRG